MLRSSSSRLRSALPEAERYTSKPFMSVNNTNDGVPAHLPRDRIQEALTTGPHAVGATNLSLYALTSPAYNGQTLGRC